MTNIRTLIRRRECNTYKIHDLKTHEKMFTIDPRRMNKLSPYSRSVAYALLEHVDGKRTGCNTFEVDMTKPTKRFMNFIDTNNKPVMKMVWQGLVNGELDDSILDLIYDSIV